MLSRFFLSRRQVLGGVLATAAMPNAAMAQHGRDPNRQEPTDVRIRLSFNDLGLTATLYDNPSTRDLASMLPISLKIEDYGGNEKIVHLPRKLTEEGSGPSATSGQAISATSSRGATWRCSMPAIAGTVSSGLAAWKTPSTRSSCAANIRFSSSGYDNLLPPKKGPASYERR